METQRTEKNASILKSVQKNRAAYLSFWVLVLLVLSAVFAGIAAPYDPLTINLDAVNEPPSLDHVFGTDGLGRDILSRVMYGSRVSLSVGFVSTISALLIGLFFGVAGGYFGGKIDRLVLAVIDITLAFPSLLLAIGITAVFKGGLMTVYAALSLVGWAAFARIIRGAVLSLKEREFVEAAHGVGASAARIIVTHLVPNIVPLAIVVMTMKIGGFIMSEASLSFLGLGIEPPYPSWGSMISDGVEYIRSCPWITIFPGLALFATVLSFNMLGDALRDVFDPKSD
jgi:peptide/nickel transport system permease protein